MLAGLEDRPVANGTMATRSASPAPATVAPLASTSASASSGDGPLTLEEKIRQLELQLLDKTQRLDELETAILEDDERLSKLDLIERLEAEIKERDLIDNERDEELRLLQDVIHSNIPFNSIGLKLQILNLIDLK